MSRRSRDREPAERRPAPQRTDPPERREPVTVAPLTVPALLGGLVVGLVSGYLLGPWAGVIVLAGAIGAVVLASRAPAQREVAVAGAVGLLLGFGGVMLLLVLTVLS